MQKFFDQSWDTFRRITEITLGVGLAVALAVSHRKEMHSLEDDAALGLMTIIALAYVFEPIAHKRSVHDLRLSVAAIESTTREMKKNISAVHGMFADRMENYTLALRFTNKNLNHYEMPVAWEQMLWSMRGSLDATSYVKPDDYKFSYTDTGIEIQKIKILVAKARIRRIFILDSERELEAIRPHIAKQLAANIEAYFVYKSEVENAIDTSSFETYDFGLFDESQAVFLWHLKDADRSLTGGTIEIPVDRSNRRYEEYRQFFEVICKNSHKFPVDFRVQPTVTCPRCAGATLQYGD